MRAFTAGSCLLLALAVTTAPMATAQARPKKVEANQKKKPKKVSKRDRARAKKAFNRGYKLFQELDYKRALEAFQKSYNLSGFAGVLYYIGLCYQKLGNYRVAITKLEDFLRLDENAPESDHANARGQIEDMKKRLAEEERIREQERKEAEARLQANLQSSGRDQEQDESLLKSWKFWTVVGAVAVAGGVTTYLLLRGDDGIPDSDLGNIDLRNTALLRF